MERVEPALPGLCELAICGTAAGTRHNAPEAFRGDRISAMSGENAFVTEPTVLTIGHSTRTLDAFIEMLRARGVKHLLDVRTIPRSRHNPQFNRDTLPEALRSTGITYTHLERLGGLRHARPDSPNTGWHNSSFRGFADYMQTPEFEAGLEKLIELAAREQTVIMCAEAVPWRCHRSLIADALKVRGVQVEHIMSASRAQPHLLTPFAMVSGIHITYPDSASGTRIVH